MTSSGSLWRVAATVAILILSGCAKNDRQSLRECAEATNLEADAYERLARIRNTQSDQILDRLASEAYESAAQNRASACFSFPPDQFVSAKRLSTEE
jgi:hypothetical protein